LLRTSTTKSYKIGLVPYFQGKTQITISCLYK